MDDVTRPTPADNTAGKQRGRPFPPGQSGNPLGRPKGSRNKHLQEMQEVLDARSPEIAAKVVELALEGRMTALRVAMDRILPKRQRPVAFEGLPSVERLEDVAVASNAIFEACREGVLTPAEGQGFMTLLRAHGEVLAEADFHARLTSVEQKRKSLES